MKITDYEIARYRLPAGKKEKLEFDDAQPGFAVHFRASGAHSFVLQYGNDKDRRRPTIGRVGELKAAEARKTAQEWMAALRSGRDPWAERAMARTRSGQTLERLLPEFFRDRSTEWKTRTHREATYSLTKHLAPWRQLPIGAIDQPLVAARLNEVEAAWGPAARNSVRAYCSTFFEWAIAEGLCRENPTLRTRKVTIPPRQRKLSDAEVRLILLALNEPGHVDEDYRDILKLALYLGLRRNELGLLRWEEVDLDRGQLNFPIGRLKNKKSWTVPLSSPAYEILRTRHAKLDPETPRLYVFGRRGDTTGYSGWSKSKRQFDIRVTELNGGELQPWTPHDFRRLVATKLVEELHVAPHLASVILGHAEGGVMSVYNLADHVDERARILEAWARHLEEILTGERLPAKVVSLGKRRR